MYLHQKMYQKYQKRSCRSDKHSIVRWLRGFNVRVRRMSLDSMDTSMRTGEPATADDPPRAPIQLKPELQKSAALSTAGAEYYPASLGAAAVIHLRQLLRGMGFEPESPTPVRGDSTAAMACVDSVERTC